jgi:nucleoside-diphosphate kinase
MAIEETLVLIKPDGMRRNLIGKIIARFEKEGLKITGLKLTKADIKLAERHYTDSDAQIVGMGNKTLGATGDKRAKEIFGTTNPKDIGFQLRGWMLNFIVSTPVVAIVLHGEDAVQKVRRIAGFTDPSKAEKGTIRGDLGVDSIAKANEEGRATENLIHASGSAEEAQQEIALWFEKIVYY